MLKKQTVWLLTMLSLVVVLSVYYIMSPESKNAVQMQSEKARLTAERSQLKKRLPSKTRRKKRYRN